MSKPLRPLIGVTGQYAHYAHPPETVHRLRNEHTIRSGYFEAVIQAGGLPVLIPAVPDPGVTADYLDRVAGVLFTGCGQDYPPAWYGEADAPETRPLGPPRSESDRLLMSLALRGPKPLMGICAGFQLFNLCSGGSLIQHVRSSTRHTALSPTEDACHEVTVEPSSRLAGILGAGRLRVNSSHHQGVDLARIAPGLKPSAVAPDGIVEALEPCHASGPFRLFVQWHPERIDDTAHKAGLFAAFVSACGTTPS